MRVLSVWEAHLAQQLRKRLGCSWAKSQLKTSWPASSCSSSCAFTTANEKELGQLSWTLLLLRITKSGRTSWPDAIVMVKAPEKHLRNKNSLRLNDVGENTELRARIAGSADTWSYTRLPAPQELREAIQEEALSWLFPTTTIGSFPQTSGSFVPMVWHFMRWVASEDYDKFLAEMKSRRMDQMRLKKVKFDVLVHSEFERNDMVECFRSKLVRLPLLPKNGWSAISYTVWWWETAILGVMSLVSKAKVPLSNQILRYAQKPCPTKPVKGVDQDQL